MFAALDGVSWLIAFTIRRSYIPCSAQPHSTVKEFVRFSFREKTIWIPYITFESGSASLDIFFFHINKGHGWSNTLRPPRQTGFISDSFSGAWNHSVYNSKLFTIQPQQWTFLLLTFNAHNCRRVVNLIKFAFLKEYYALENACTAPAWTDEKRCFSLNAYRKTAIERCPKHQVSFIFYVISFDEEAFRGIVPVSSVISHQAALN